MLIDTFPYAYVPQVLLLRLRELADVVDRHVLVEMDATHTGVAREYAWPLLRELPEFAPFADRVTFCPIGMPSQARGYPWRAEEHIRNVCLERALIEAQHDDDVILIADHDEIPHPAALARVLDGGIKRARLFGAYHEWFLNLRAVGSPGHLWEFRQPITLLAGDPVAENLGAGADLRALQWTGDLGAVELGKDDGYNLQGWHMTLQGGSTAVRRKLQAGAHTELQRFSVEQIERLIAERRDILDRCRLMRTEHLPVAARDDCFREMLWTPSET